MEAPRNLPVPVPNESSAIEPNIRPPPPPADTLEAGAGPPAAAVAPCASQAARSRRTVKVSDLDKVTLEVQQLRLRCDALETGLEASQRVVESSRTSLNGLRALQEVARQEQYPLGRALQRRLSTRFIERLKPPPPSGLNRSRDGASQRENRAKVVLAFEADADRRSMDELVAMLSLSYTVPGISRRERAARLIEFPTPASLVAALGLSDNLRSWAMARSFTRPSDGSTPSRVVVERYDDDEGSSWFILNRLGNGDLRVASRLTEEFNPQQRRFVHPLKRATVPRVDLPGCPETCPAFLRWRPSPAAFMVGYEEGLTCGRVTLSLPCCVVELGAEEVLSALEREKEWQEEQNGVDGGALAVRGVE